MGGMTDAAPSGAASSGMTTTTPAHTTPGTVRTPRIVVGVDGSPGSRHALAWAIREARRRGANVEALLVWSDPWAILGPSSTFPLSDQARAPLRNQLATAVHAARREAGELPGHPDVRVDEHVVVGDPVEVLCRESAGADLLVVGTRGLGGLKHVLLGSVSEHCAQLSATPVVIVPPPEGGQER